MTRAQGSTMGVIFGLMIGLIIAIILIKIANRGKIKTNYDERQRALRGQGYMYGFYTLVILMAADCLWTMSGMEFPIPEYIARFGEMIIGMIVMCVYCIWKGAYWGLNNDRKRYGIILVAAGLLNLIPVIPAFINGNLTSGDMLDSLPWMNIIVLIMMLAIGITLLIKAFVDKAEKEEEDV